jgi:hypothetical protein
MMKHRNNLSNQQQEETQQQQTLRNSTQTHTEFASVEEMLRHDATHTPVPPAIAQRLQESLGPVAPPPRSWWRKFFGS